MFELNLFEMANYIMDGTALFILAGIIIYTSLFRKRARPADKVFFAMILLDATAALSDIVYELGLSLGGIPSSQLSLICVLIFFISIDFFMFLLSIYVIFRRQWDSAKLRKYLPILCAPLVIFLALLILGVYLAFFYQGEPIINLLLLTSYNSLQYSPAIVFSIITLLAVFKRNKRVLILLVVLGISHAFLAFTSTSTISPLMMTVYLIYAHLFAMRDSFYEETAEEC